MGNLSRRPEPCERGGRGFGTQDEAGDRDGDVEGPNNGVGVREGSGVGVGERAAAGDGDRVWEFLGDCNGDRTGQKLL